MKQILLRLVEEMTTQPATTLTRFLKVILQRLQAADLAELMIAIDDLRGDGDYLYFLFVLVALSDRIASRKKRKRK